MHIRLETTDGALIAETETEAKFPPDVITYQCRIFVDSGDMEDGVYFFREATVYHLNSVESDIKDA